MAFSQPLVFPPLFTAQPVKAQLDPFAKAVAQAGLGAEAGTLFYAQSTETAKMTLVLNPEMPLEKAIGVVFAVSLGVSDSLGALAPPEVGVHFTWPDGFRVNGATCGKMSVACDVEDANETPGWLVVGVEIPMTLSVDREPGADPTQTSLAEEGCADITAPQLIESWSRHTLYWINRFLEEGFAPLHKNWCGRCEEIGEHEGEAIFVGLDENGGKLLRTGDKTTVVPLTEILRRQS